MPTRKPPQDTLSFVIPGDLETPTGGYIYDRRIIAGLRKRGWHVRVIPLDSSFPKPTRAAVRHARHELRQLPEGSLTVIDGLAFGSFPEELVEDARRLNIVALVHHPLALETGLDEPSVRRFRESERLALTAARRVIVTSRWTRRTLGAYGVSPARVRVVEPGVDRPRMRRRLTHRKPGSPIKLLCVATLTKRKGHRDLVDALARVRDRRWTLRCVGSDSRDAKTAAALIRQIDALDLEARVKLVGEVSGAQLRREYANADVFVLASHMEGYGMVLTEALSHGLPIVSTRAGAIPETVPRSARHLVTPGNVGSLAKALSRVLEDPEELLRLTRAAAAARRHLPTWDLSAKRFDAALRGVVPRS